MKCVFKSLNIVDKQSVVAV